MARATNLLVIALIVFPSMVLATEYVVGDDEGWNSGVDYYAWLDGKTFYVGDVLVFNYNAGDHNVIVVDANGYDQCSASPNWGSYDSGNDVITLSSTGDNYYICQWHCDYTDQKLKVTVLQN
ncbi:stellacyanin-like [Prunus avium]|uniref:Stellacyanin-like n=1 Tax=Prunus avium TaxID=42229 RepID=A0A6P5TG05_PRUAV|nr:stellacyanin-like [Prunus avium]